MAEKRSGGDRGRRQSSDRQGRPSRSSSSGKPRSGGSGKPRSGDSGRPRSGGSGTSRSSGGAGSSKGRSQGGSRSRSDDRGRRDSGARDPQRSSSSKDYRERQHEGRHGKDSQSRSGQRRAFSVDGGPSNLPKWLKEEIQRATPNDRQEATLELLSEAASDFADEQFKSAHRKLLKAKNLSSRASAIRELLGLTCYRLGNWDEALRELRAFRRFTGDTSHMPIEMDSLRGLKRHADVDKTWHLFMELGGSPPTDAEARVVYGSFLIDQDRAREAWNITKPARTAKDSKPNERRRWFVAAKAALVLGDPDTALKLVSSVRDGDPDMPGLDELTDQIAAAQN